MALLDTQITLLSVLLDSVSTQENANMMLLALLMFSHVYINYTKVCGKIIGYQIGSLIHLVED